MRLRLLALVAFSSLSLWACQKKAASQQAPGPEGVGTPAVAAAPADANTLLLGEVGSLTGAQATFGISSRNGIQLALEEANAHGGVNGKRLAVRVYDDQGKAEEAANAMKRLVNQDRVLLVLGEVASSNSLAMADVAQAARVPMISPSSTNAKVTQRGDYIFRVCFIDPFQGFVMAKFARENLKLNKVSVLKDQKSDYSQGLSDVFARKFTEMGGKVVGVEAYAQGDSDFRAQLTAIKAQGPEAIYVPGYYTDVGIVARQARELGLKVPLLGGDGWDSEKLYELGGTAIEGSYFSNHYSPEDPSPTTQAFIQSYKKEFGGVPDALAALAYDAANVAVDALKRAKDLTGSSIRDAIAQTKDFKGAAGTITLDENRNAVKPAVVLQVGDRTNKYVTTVTP
jgi:branched-chain amino acid transport system substrate-binding protein